MNLMFLVRMDFVPKKINAYFYYVQNPLVCKNLQTKEENETSKVNSTKLMQKIQRLNSQHNSLKVSIFIIII